VPLRQLQQRGSADGTGILIFDIINYCVQLHQDIHTRLAADWRGLIFVLVRG